jgi:hypothetical protein
MEPPLSIAFPRLRTGLQGGVQHVGFCCSHHSIVCEETVTGTTPRVVLPGDLRVAGERGDPSQSLSTLVPCIQENNNDNFATHWW